MKIKEIVLLAITSLLLVSCTQDVSREEPFVKAIGKHFFLQQDMYLYQFHESRSKSWPALPCKLRIGDINPKSWFFYDLPSTVEEKYIGAQNSYVTLKGILWKGTTFTIKRVVIQKSLDFECSYYLISPDQGSFMNQEINPYDIMEMLSNPPESDTWSDPPIFDPKVALPLPSDGIWWK